jgi:hypothetical protein
MGTRIGWVGAGGGRGSMDGPRGEGDCRISTLVGGLETVDRPRD